jgi:hypothetical protein
LEKSIGGVNDMDNNKHKFSKSVYDMELHEELIADPIIDDEFECLPLRVLKVPGGWIYYNVYVTSVGVFVPFVNKRMEEGLGWNKIE